jgi:hypothetical protein
VIDVGDNGKITDKGEFGHEPPLAGLPCPFKHGGTPVGVGCKRHVKFLPLRAVEESLVTCDSSFFDCALNFTMWSVENSCSCCCDRQDH